jgi:endonuclease YncB( thermonuclease family)
MWVYPKVSRLSPLRNKQQQQQQQQQQTLIQKQHKGLWRQNSLDWLIKYPRVVTGE